METALALYLTLRHAHIPQEPSKAPGIHIYANKHVTALQSVSDKYNVTFGLGDGVLFQKATDGKTVIVKKADPNQTVQVSKAFDFMASLFHVTVQPAAAQPTLEVVDSPSHGMRIDGVQPAYGKIQ